MITDSKTLPLSDIIAFPTKKVVAPESQDSVAEKLISEFPWLELSKDSKKSHLALGAANLRKMLKRAFPAVKFSVKSDSYAGGCSINIHWTDGVTVEQVKAYTERFQCYDFDGRTDSRIRRKNPFAELFGGADYTPANRSYSPERYVETAEEMGFKEATMNGHGDMNNSENEISPEVSDEIKRATWKKAF